MLKEIVDVYNDMKEKYENPEKIVLDNYKLDEGTYILIEIDDEEFYIKDPIEIIYNEAQNDKKDIIIKNEEYIKFLDYNSKIISTNKSVIAPNKTISSNNYLTLFFKKESAVNINKNLLKNYYDKLKNIEKKYKNKNKEAYDAISENLEILNIELIERIENWIYDNKIWENIENKPKEKGYFKIFFVLKNNKERTKELYINESKRYLFPKIYNKNKYNLKVNNKLVGLSGSNIVMNSKKPFFENKTRKIKVPNLITQENMLDNYEIFKLMENFIEEEKYNIYVDYDNNTIKGYKNGELPQEKIKTGAYFNIFLYKGKNKIEAAIQEYDTISNFGDKTCKSFQYRQVIKTNLEGDKHEYMIYEKYSDIQRLINGVLFEYKLIENYFSDASGIKIKNLKIKEELLMTREIYLKWFYKGVTNNICNTLEKSILKIVKSNILEGKFIVAKQQMNLRYSLISYFTNKKEEELLMEDVRKFLIKKIKLSIEEQDNWEIENDDVYSYLIGQIVSGLLLLSKAKTVPSSIINQFLNTDNSQIIKNKLTRLYEKYNYAIEARRYNKLESCLGKVLRYEVENKINKNLLLAGFLDNQIFFIKKDEYK